MTTCCYIPTKAELKMLYTWRGRIKTGHFYLLNRKKIFWQRVIEHSRSLLVLRGAERLANSPFVDDTFGSRNPSGPERRALRRNQLKSLTLTPSNKGEQRGAICPESVVVRGPCPSHPIWGYWRPMLMIGIHVRRERFPNSDAYRSVANKNATS
jgi:hypothetical protein